MPHTSPTEGHMRSCPRLTTLLLACAGLFLSACHVPDATAHSVLQISAAGALTLDGAPVSHEQLNNALVARQGTAPGVLVEVRASPQADIAQVKGAVAAVELAHARVAFAGELGQQ
jgi:biopolymer transport protein ExbD